MASRFVLRARRYLPAFATVVLASTTNAQPGGPPNNSSGPKLPTSGPIPRDTARERSIVSQSKVPAGFTATVFAGPPIAMYPTVVAPSPDGSVYVGVDLNLAQGAGQGRGRIMRLLDTDHDGHADQYSTFVEVSSPRGIIADGKTVYVMHPPNLTAYRDTNGDGVADESEDLVRGLGFGIDVRSSDHSTNNITMGIDGWIYVAVGDYGYAEAVGKDGTKIRRHGGSIVRVRPDGTGLEIYAVGSRNTYDVGIDPFMHVFARDNTNDGGGWNTRFHYLPPLAEMGYPSLFLNFPEETMQTLFDFGAGAGTGGLWIQDPGFPVAMNNQLFTSDWTVNKVLFNPVTKRGASYSVTQKDFVEISHPVDFAMDDQSHLFVASLIGGVFNYAGDTVGAILQVRYPGRAPAAALNPTTRTDAQLVSALVSANVTHRVWAQRELVRRPVTSATLARLRTIILNRALPAESRAAALFTLPLLAGAEAQATLRVAARDPALREIALRTIVDDTRHLSGVDPEMYVAALGDAQPAVRVQAINGLARLGATKAAPALVPLLGSSDSTLSHVAMRALAQLNAREVALAALSNATPAIRTRARFALQLMHSTETTDALLAAYAGTAPDVAKEEMLAALARLYNTDAAWNGEWWGTHPNNIGPYFMPVAWEASARIKPVLRAALTNASAGALASRVTLYAKNRVIPLGARPLLSLAMNTPEQNAVLDALVGNSRVTPDVLSLLSRLDAGSPAMHGAVATLLAAETDVLPAAMPLLQRAALDVALSDSLRGQIVSAIAARPGAPDETVKLLALVNPLPPGPNADGAATGAVDAAWRRYVGARERSAQIEYFIGLTTSGTAAERTLAFSILLQSIRSARVQPAVRSRVTPIINDGWSNTTNAPNLARAVRIMRLDAQYAEQLKAVPTP